MCFHPLPEEAESHMDTPVGTRFDRSIQRDVFQSRSGTESA